MGRKSLCSMRKEIQIEKELYEWLAAESVKRKEPVTYTIARMLRLGRLYLERGSLERDTRIDTMEAVVGILHSKYTEISKRIENIKRSEALDARSKLGAAKL